MAVIDTGTYDLEKAQEYVDTVAEFYGLPIARLTGSLRLLEKLIRGPHDEEFIIVEPGEGLDERIFWEMSTDANGLPAETLPNPAGIVDDPDMKTCPR